MFPGFVSIYKDRYVHLYFYPGITDNNEDFYNALDLTHCKLSYKEIHNSDGSTEYIFDNTKIKSITCQLIHKNNIDKDIIKLAI